MLPSLGSFSVDYGKAVCHREFTPCSRNFVAITQCYEGVLTNFSVFRLGDA